MNIFCGCDPESMDDLVERFLEYAERLRRLIELLRSGAVSVSWTGPDAEQHRADTELVAMEIDEVVRAVRDRAEEIRAEAEQQEVTSRPDDAAGGWEHLRPVRAEGPWGGVTPDGLPRMTERSRLEDLGPMIGGPFMAEDPLRWADTFSTGFGPEDLGPMIGGPFMMEDPVERMANPRPLPEGEEFDLSPETLERAEEIRRDGFAWNRWTAGAQALLDAHAGIGSGLDRAEGALRNHGLGEFTPVISALRIPHEATSVIAGENSVLGQVTSGTEHIIANADQTSHEVSEALGEGDLAGAIRAGERGIYRHGEGVFGIATANALPAVIDAAEGITGHAADVVEPVSPEASRFLNETQETMQQVAAPAEHRWNQVSDAENWYDARRRLVEMPWDPQARAS